MCLTVLIASAQLVTNAAQVAEAVFESRCNVPFALTGVVTLLRSRSFTLVDESGRIAIQCNKLGVSADGVSLGDTVHAKGRTLDYDRGIVFAECESVVRIAGGAVVGAPVDADISTAMSGSLDYHTVRTRGVMREVFQDETEPNTIYIALFENGDMIYLTHADEPGNIQEALARLRRMIGDRISVEGICVPFNQGYRRLIGRSLMVHSLDAIVPIGSPVDSFSAPEIDDTAHINPTSLSRMGLRRATGRVIAVRADGTFYMRDARHEIRRVRPADSASRPAVGDGIEAVGFPETDLYRINLSSAVWRRFSMPPDDDTPTAKRIDRLLRDAKGYPKIAVTSHGRLIRITGTVADGFDPAEGATTFTVAENGHGMTVDATSAGPEAPVVPAGSRVEATGVAIVDVETWNPYASFPHVTGMVVAVRGADDVKILSRPPWWTPAKLLVVIGSLAASLVLIIIWNRVLNRAVERRSRQLARARTARDRAEFRIGERTRLATEIHDALSQTLTGVSFQIDAAEQARQKNPSQIKQFLDTARQTLLSCRKELRNCLWDLRSNALEEPDATLAIRRTVEPHVGDAELSVDFAVMRSAMDDSTFHAVLSIVRELAVNASLHGAASRISIRGRLEGDFISIEVSDDGRGFDPVRRPGVSAGHFGLLGVSERAESFGGEMSIDSAPGRGTKIRVTLHTTSA